MPLLNRVILELNYVIPAKAGIQRLFFIIVFFVCGLKSATGQVADSSILADVLALPFRNLTAVAEAKTFVTSAVRQQLESAGFRAAEAESVQHFLRLHRVRNTGQITSSQATELSRTMDTPWILLGSIDVYSQNDNPEVGFSARLLNSLSGEVIWADSRYVSGADYAGVLGLGEIASTERLASLEVHELIQSLRHWWLKHPEKIHAEANSGHDQASFMIIPFDNTSASETAGQIADNVLLSLLVQRGFRVIEPGTVKEQMMAVGAAVKGGIDLTTLEILQDRFEADYSITGMLSAYQEAAESEDGESPTVQLDIRLLQAETGKLIRAQRLERTGRDYVKIFQFGLIRNPARLLKIVLEEALDSMPCDSLLPLGFIPTEK